MAAKPLPVLSALEIAVVGSALGCLAMTTAPIEPSVAWTAVGSLLFSVVGGATVWSRLQLATVATSARLRWGWGLLAAAGAIVWAYGSYWTALEVLWNQRPSRTVAWLDFAHFPFLVAGFLTFPRDRWQRRIDGSSALDLGLLGLALALSWYIALGSVLFAPTALRLSLSLFPPLDCLVILCGVVTLLGTPVGRLRNAVGLTVAGQYAYFLMDYYWSLATPEYHAGQWIDAVWLGAWLLQWTGARVALREASPAPGAAASRDSWPLALGVGAMVPLFLVARLDPRTSPLALTCAAGTIGLLLTTRQQVTVFERRRLVRQTAQQAARYEALVASATELLLVIDGDGSIGYANPAARRTFGDLEWRHLVDLVHPDDANELTACVLDDSGRKHTTSARMRTSGGPWCTIELQVQDRRHDPTIRGVVMNGRDVTAELALDAELRHARKLEMLSAMAGRLAHAFNNTLGVLSAHADVLAGELPSRHDARDDVRAIQRAIERGTGITRQLLAFSGRHVNRPEAMWPLDVVDGLRPATSRLLPPSVRLEVLAAAPSNAVWIDRSQLEQAILNLVTNARDAMPDGGALRIAVDDVRHEGRPAARITVSDDGIGMGGDMRAHAFEPFFTTKAPGRGTGLGLAMVRSIVTRAGGAVELASAVGRGTTVSLVLPATSEVPASSALPATQPALPAPVTVLLVDDDALMRRACRRMLEHRHCQVLEAEDGATALAMAARHDQPIDVLLTDLLMPGVSGRDVIARFKTLRPDVPVIAMTGFASDRTEPAVVGLSVFAILPKPFTIDGLHRTVSSAIAQGRRRAGATW